MVTKMKSLRLSGRALELVEEMQLEDMRSDSDLVRLAIILYAEKHHPELAEELKKELSPISRT